MPTRVLVADDESDIRTLVRIQLRRVDDLDVVEAADGDEALALAVADPSPDLLVLDYRMPGRTGADVAATLRARDDLRPIVLFSAYLQPALEQRARELGVDTCGKHDLPRLVRWVESRLRG